MKERDGERILTQGLAGVGVVTLVVAAIVLLGLAFAAVTALVF